MNAAPKSYGGIKRLADYGETIQDTVTGMARSKKEVEAAFYDAYLQDACGDEYGPVDYEAGYRAFLKEYETDLLSFVNGEW